MTNEISPDLTALNVQMLRQLCASYRAMKGDPEHDEKLVVIAGHALAIGTAYAVAGGLQAMHALVAKIEESGDDIAAEWVSRRWEGVRAPDGSVWSS